MSHITRHAIDRFRERIADIPEEQIRARLDTPAVRAAIAFGARYVRIATGHRLAVHNGCIITILPPEHFRRQVLREGLSRYGSSFKAHRRTRDDYEGGEK